MIPKNTPKNAGNKLEASTFSTWDTDRKTGKQFARLSYNVLSTNHSFDANPHLFDRYSALYSTHHRNTLQRRDSTRLEAVPLHEIPPAHVPSTRPSAVVCTNSISSTSALWSTACSQRSQSSSALRPANRHMTRQYKTELWVL